MNNEMQEKAEEIKKDLIKYDGYSEEEADKLVKSAVKIAASNVKKLFKRVKMAKYRKKIVVIEAIQWDGTKQKFDEIVKLGLKWYPGDMGSDSFYIRTLGIKMKVKKGDYIIKDEIGEFYPCKPDIFEKAYDAL